MRFHKCPSCVSPYNKQLFQQSPSSKSPGPQNSFEAELSRELPPRHNKNRASILGPLRSPGTGSATQRHQRCARSGRFLEPFTECAQSVRIRTDMTLDQECVLKATVFVFTTRTVCLKATVQVCTACMDVSLLTTLFVSQHSSSRAGCNFDARFASRTWKKARLPTRSVQAPECRSDHHGSCSITAWS